MNSQDEPHTEEVKTPREKETKESTARKKWHQELARFLMTSSSAPEEAWATQFLS